MADSPLYKSSLIKAMNLCSRREYCCNDIRKKLLLWGVPDDDVNRIISVLLNENFINELRYASAFVRDKFNYNKWGKVKITAHLKNNKITHEIINSALGSIDNETYIQCLKDLIKNHRRSVKAKNKYDLKAKLMRYAASKGYESSILYDLLNDMETNC